MVNELSDLVLPETDVPEKVVQLYIGSKPLLICGNASQSHGTILEQVLKERSLEYETFDAGSEGSPFHIPKPSGSRYEVVGMGTCQLLGPNLYLLGGRSEDYSTPQKIMSINEEHARKIRELYPNLIKPWRMFIELE